MVFSCAELHYGHLGKGQGPVLGHPCHISSRGPSLLEHSPPAEGQPCGTVAWPLTVPPEPHRCPLILGDMMPTFIPLLFCSVASWKGRGSSFQLAVVSQHFQPASPATALTPVRLAISGCSWALLPTTTHPRLSSTTFFNIMFYCLLECTCNTQQGIIVALQVESRRAPDRKAKSEQNAGAQKCPVLLRPAVLQGSRANLKETRLHAKMLPVQQIPPPTPAHRFWVLVNGAEVTIKPKK